MIYIIIFIVIIYLFVYYTNFCSVNKEYTDSKKIEEEVIDSGVKSVESFLDYSLVDKTKYPERVEKKCDLNVSNKHISFYQREPPEENSWVFGYPHNRNYIGGAHGIK